MCRRSLTGIHRRSYGSRWFWAFLSVLWLFSASSLSGQTPQEQKPYSEMTRAELLTQIEEKDRLLADWLTLYEQLTMEQNELTKALSDYRELLQKAKALQKEHEEASADQLASRDKVIADQEAVIDDYRSKESLAWIEKIIWALGGAGLGFTGGSLTAGR